MIRRRLTAIGLSLAMLAFPVSIAAQFSYVGFEQIPVAGTAIGFTIAKICPDSQSASICTAGGRQATVAFCDLETANVRYTMDGTTPTSTVGHLWTNGNAPIVIYGSTQLQKFRAIRVSSSAQINCTYSAP